jgi:tetratricopeptide (TPR) repeat protein
LSVLFAVGAVLVPTASALAQTSEPAPEVRAQAESIANQAFEEYRQGNYEAAIESYERALQLASSGALLFNIARIYDTRLSDPKQAETYYQRCVDNPGTEPDLVRRANERLQALRDARKSAAEPTTEPRSERVDQPAAAGTNKTETLPRTVRPSQAPAVQATRLDDTTTGSGLTTAGLVVGSIGLVGMGVGGYFGLSAASKNNDAGDMCPNDVCADPKGVDLTEDARSAARLSTGFMVGGGALVASGIALLIAGSGASRERPESHALRLTPAIGDGSAGMFMKGAW